jgi:hypothetical protein
MRTILRTAATALLAAAALLVAAAPADAKPDDKPAVSLGSFTGPQARVFKGGIASHLRKENKVVGKKTARAVVEGVVEEEDGKFRVRVIVRDPTSNEVVEERSYAFAKPKVDAGRGRRIARDVAEMARRAPAR